MLLDILFTCFIIIFSIIGYIRGFIKEMTFLTSIILSFPIREEILKLSFFDSLTSFHVITKILIQVLVFLVLRYMFLFLSKYVETFPVIGTINKILGVSIGAIKGLIIIGIAVLTLILSLSKDNQTRFDKNESFYIVHITKILEDKYKVNDITNFDEVSDLLKQIYHDSLRLKSQEKVLDKSEDISDSKTEKQS